jgi:hypothetical protein
LPHQGARQSKGQAPGKGFEKKREKPDLADFGANLLAGDAQKVVHLATDLMI